MGDLRREATEGLDRLAHSSPVFIIGAPCSDASSLATALTAGDELWCSGESHLFYHLAGPDAHGRSKLYSAYEHGCQDSSFWLPRNRVVYQEFAAYLGLGIDQLFRSRANGKRWIDASPENTLIAPDLAYLFPKAMFVNITRDGRDAVALMLEVGLVEGSEEGFAKACDTWRIYGERSLDFEERFSRRVLELRHEGLVHDTRQEAEKTVRFLGTKRMKEVAGFLAVETKSFQERLWRGWSEERRGIFTDRAGDMMQEFGYSLAWD